MATGTCLVATDGGALPEVTGSDNDTVLGCKAGDAEGLAAALRRGLADPELRARIGAAGRQRVAERWSWTHCAQLTVDQYREVLAMPANQAKLRANGR
jgi:glycosyltransferase involved in cell wall biosynthesis